jgi:HNH endonuclease
MTRHTPIIDRLLPRIEISPTGCWLWQGPINENGYGTIGGGPRVAGHKRVHRVTYEHFVGPIADGLQIDHLCRVRHCCNPEHLEAVTRTENVRRGIRKTRQTHCKRGHEFTPENTLRNDRQRVCLTCKRAAARAYLQRKRVAA